MRNSKKSGRTVFLLIVLASLYPIRVISADFGLHRSQEYIIANLLEKKSIPLPLKHTELHTSVDIESSPLKDENLTWLEIDSVYHDEIQALTVTHGTEANGKLAAYEIYNDKHLPLDVLVKSTWKNKAFKFWIDLKNLDSNNAPAICDYLAKNLPSEIFSNTYIEARNVNGLVRLRYAGCKNTIYWQGGKKLSEMSFLKLFLYKLKIKYLMKPQFISQHYKSLPNSEMHFPDISKAVWTTGILQEFKNIDDANRILKNLTERTSLILIDSEISKKHLPLP